ncbi:MAG: hypothetical protein NWE98_03435 [Candidatus Bathyarchaeota archaeon]|nr:hypothetical protein [Candidatus Bathyarchaeota archaeon]
MIFILLLAVPSLIIVEPATAQSIPKPSKPEFTVKYITQTTIVPETTPTYTIDPYSGKEKILTPGRSSYNYTSGWLELKIKNQPFTPYINSDGRYIELYYNLRYKGHYGTSWNYYPFNPDGISTKTYGGWDMTYLIPYNASDTEYTIISTGLDNLGIPHYGQVDFQVQAQIGYIQDTGDAFAARVWGIHYNFTGESSDWSDTQTITISEIATSPNQTETPTSTLTPTLSPDSTPTPYNSYPNLFLSDNMQLTIIAVIFAVFVVVIASLSLYIKKLKSKQSVA